MLGHLPVRANRARTRGCEPGFLGRLLGLWVGCASTGSYFVSHYSSLDSK